MPFNGDGYIQLTEFIGLAIRSREGERERGSVCVLQCKFHTTGHKLQVNLYVIELRCVDN